jgi:ATP-binding cassette subfamily F protein uup
MGRLLLARLFARPANVLVLDEPTNDLDIDTLELLEQLLQDYEGTVFLVSHDRAFLDNVVTSTLAWDGPASGASTKAACRTGWRKARAGRPCARGARSAARCERKTPAPAPDQREPLQKEAELQGAARTGRPARAHRSALEGEQADIRRQLADGTLYQSDLRCRCRRATARSRRS